MEKIIMVVMLVALLSGCVHFKNQKGVEIKGKDFQTKVGKIEKGKAHYWSELDIWFPSKPKETCK